MEYLILGIIFGMIIAVAMEIRTLINNVNEIKNDIKELKRKLK